MQPTTNLAHTTRLIWTEGEISRADVARRLGLSRSTVSALVQQLIDQKTVAEARVGRSRGGRPPIMLRFQHQRYHMVGLDLGMAHITATLMDPRGHVLARESRRHDVAGDPPSTLDAVHQMLDAILTQHPRSSRLIGLGVAAPCPIRADRPGHLSHSILPSWRDVDLGGLLAERYSCPVYLENDANLGALGELIWGMGRDVGDFVYVKLATGVGAGLIVRGDIYRGAEGVAGEIGHTSIDANGPPCECGLRGCLVTMLGSRAIESRYRAAADAPASLDAIAEAAAAGDPVASEEIAWAAHCLGIGLANLLNIINPSRIVLGGHLTLAGDALLEPLARAIQGRALWSNVEAADVVLSELGDDIIPIGAATLVLLTALADPRSLTTGLPQQLPRRSSAVAGGPQATP